jgi:hypothetical protein
MTTFWPNEMSESLFLPCLMKFSPVNNLMICHKCFIFTWVVLFVFSKAACFQATFAKSFIFIYFRQM